MLKAHYANAIGDNLVKAGIRVNKSLELGLSPISEDPLNLRDAMKEKNAVIFPFIDIITNC